MASAAIFAPALSLILAAPACAHQTTTQSTPADPKMSASPAAAQPKTARQILDEQYVMGPTAVDEFGFRIAWQTEALATKDATAEITSPAADSIWFGDSAGSVVRVRRDNGETVWRASTFKGLERVFAIEHLPMGRDDRVYIITHIDCIVLDALSGDLVRRSRLSHLPTAGPAVYGPYFIYGTRSGLVNWFQYSTGFAWRASTIGGVVRNPPTVTGDVVLTGSSNGTVLAMEAGTTRVIWERKLSAGVDSRIAADRTTAFVSSRDQSLRAFDLQRGRMTWHYFTQSPLLNDPTRISDGLYLQIPEEGLVSFNPYPVDRPEGEVRWKSTAPGNVIGRLGSNLVVWDNPGKILTFVDANNGRTVAQRAMPQVKLIQMFPRVNGDLFLTALDGRIERAEPLARPEVPEETDSRIAEHLVPNAAAPESKPAQPSGAPATAPDAAPTTPDAPATPEGKTPKNDAEQPVTPKFSQRVR